MQRKKYVLGCGHIQAKAPDTVYVDINAWDGVDVVYNLEVPVWDFVTPGCATHINASHVLEHIRNLNTFMDNCHAMLLPGGTFYIEVPHAGDVDLAHSDPTHVRYFTKHTFINYLTLEGVHNFGYFKHAWSILHIEENNGIIRAHLMPIPDEALTDETLLMLNNMNNAVQS